MSEVTNSVDDFSQSGRDRDIVSSSENQTIEELDKTVVARNPDGTTTDPEPPEPITLKEAFEKFEDSSLPAKFTLSIKGIKQWDITLEREVERELKIDAEFDQSEGKLKISGEMTGSYSPGEDSNGEDIIYAPPRIKVSVLLRELLEGNPALKPLISIFDIDLIFRKVELIFCKTKTKDDDYYYLSLAIYADKKPKANDQYDDKYLLSVPGSFSPPFIPSEDYAPEIAEKPFCIVGIGKDKKDKNQSKWWGHFGLSLRAVLQLPPDFINIGGEEEVDTWAIVLPLASSFLSGRGAITYGNPFVSVSSNLSLAPKDYLESAIRFLKEKDKKKTDRKEFKKEDYVLEDRGQLRAGVIVQIDILQQELIFEYPQSESSQSATRSPDLLENQTRGSLPSESVTDLIQRYGRVLDPGIVRLGPLSLNKIGLGLETLERTDPNDENLKSRKLCFVIKPGILFGAFPAKDKSHAYLDINGLSIYIPIGDELKENAPPKLISPVEFEFTGLGVDLANKNLFRFKGGAYWNDSDTELIASGEIMFRLGPAKAPKLVIQILMSFWLERKKKKWGFYIYGLASFKPIKIPIDPVFTQTYLMGLALGLGVNYEVIIPDVDSIQEFPLVKAVFSADVLGTAPKPEDAINEMDPYLKPKPGYHWVAAGAEISVLGTFRGFFLLIAQVGLSGNFTWEICLLSVLKFADSKEKVYKIELVFKVLVAWYGLKIEFLLTSSSFLLDKNLTLTGSGYFWLFWSGEHAGEVIFVLGGYHPNYKKPKHYPSPSSISIVYKRDFGKVKFEISGSAYFAIAKKVVMLGISLSAMASINVIWHWTIWASLVVDILIFWSPFAIDANLGLEIGVSAIVKLGFVRVSISVRVGLQLSFWKSDEDQDFGGVFIFKVMAWNVKAPFGARRLSIKPKTWDEFLVEDLLLDDKNPIMLTVFNPEETLAPKVALESTPWLKASPERSSQTYEIAGRLNEEPILEATSVVPIKVLKIAEEVQPKTWNSEFGSVPCFNTSDEFKSEFEIKCDQRDLFTFDLKINPTELPINVWSPKILSKPDIEGAGIVNTLLGVNVRSSQSNLKLGNQIGPFSSSALIRNRRKFIWPLVSPAAALPSNQITIKDFQNQINSQETCTKRNALLRAIKVLQPEVKNTVRLNNTADFADLVLLATPVVNTLGN